MYSKNRLTVEAMRNGILNWVFGEENVPGKSMGVLWAHAGDLTEKEKEVLMVRSGGAGKHVFYRELAVSMGVSTTRVRQMEVNALKKIRRSLYRYQQREARFAWQEALRD